MIPLDSIRTQYIYEKDINSIYHILSYNIVDMNTPTNTSLLPNNSENTRSGVAGILSRFPHFELSYETISHRKVSEPYDVALAIPLGKKYLFLAMVGIRKIMISK